jgi:hypothetical protein
MRTGTSSRRRSAVVLALALAVVPLSACQPDARPRAIVYGDSMIYESRDELREWSTARGWDLAQVSHFGAAPCTFFDRMREHRAQRPDVVLVESVGNPDFAPCVGDDVVASFRRQVQELKRIWTGTGTRVVVVLVPTVPRHVSRWSEPVQQTMADEARRLGMDVVDGGRDVAPDRTWAWTRPCLRGEPCVGHQVNGAVPPGRNIVRADDRTHLCPGPPHGFEPCRHHSSGSWRFARTLTAALGDGRGRR